MSAKTAKPARRQRSVRKCLRCGCTEMCACACGCEWVAQSDVCSACLTEGEHAVWVELLEATRETTDAKLVASNNHLWLHFHNYLNAVSAIRPLPRILSPEFQEELAILKADRKYPEHKPQYDMLHEQPARREKPKRGRDYP